MKIQVLEEATADLADGFRFYERQAEGLGDYVLDFLWSDIHSLRLYGGTPSVAGLSRVEEFIALSDQGVLPIRCHGISPGARRG
uniref:ParE toxin of type II toxin-antitoxin system, parDE n=1 Tax=Candidatus Kentrum sp. LFY TaxID=2126342 RepID=A0A450WYQ2_9GAMM|nr:MAG: hypothetical protein BECKLFY1418C_GA0070996_11117 [Candidatus Kentron sp. LFY]